MKHTTPQTGIKRSRLEALANRRVRGFTLLELMTTLSVAAVLLAVGVPGFMSIVQNNRATAHTNDLVTALNVGRSEATRRNAVVRVCSSTDGATCAGSTNWSTGWVVRTQGPGSGELIRSWSARAGGAGIVTGTAEVRFQPRGSAAADAALAVRLPDCTGDQGRDVAVNRAGRVSVIRVGC